MTRHLPLTLAAARERGLHRLESVEQDGSLIVGHWSVEPTRRETGILHHLCGWPERFTNRHPGSDEAAPLQLFGKKLAKGAR